MSVFIIAEIGSTHDGSLGIARNSVDAAAEAGVDAVKFQTHIASAETVRDAPAPSFFAEERRYEYFERTAFSREQWRALAAHCEAAGVRFLSSPFSVEAVTLLEDVGVTHYKIPSGEVTNLGLLRRVAETGKPVLLSSGMSSWAELDRAVEVFTTEGVELSVLQCTSAYPCPYERVGLNVMREMADRYGVPVGLSDHTATNYAAFAAVCLGAAVVEKHFTLSKRLYGSDAKHSAEPAQFHDLVAGIRAIETMLASDVDKRDVAPYEDMKRVFEKSVVTLTEIPKGAVIERGMVGVKKPGTGVPAHLLDRVVGSRTRRALRADTVVTESDLLLNSPLAEPA